MLRENLLAETNSLAALFVDNFAIKDNLSLLLQTFAVTLRDQID